jgi:hypothetical protein
MTGYETTVGRAGWGYEFWVDAPSSVACGAWFSLVRGRRLTRAGAHRAAARAIADDQAFVASLRAAAASGCLQ